jgi:DNA-binding PadR family transcriptional regulator
MTPLALAALRLLRERPMHPYEMQQLIRDRSTDRVIKVRAGSLYHTIERLARNEFIEPVETGREGRRPERTVYAITEAGRDEYVTNLRDLIRHPAEEFPVFAAAIEMLRSLDRDDVLGLLEQRTTGLEALLAAHDQVTASLAKRGLDRFATIEVEYTQAMWRAELGWVRQLIDDIRSGELTWPAEGVQTWPWQGPNTIKEPQS